MPGPLELTIVFAIVFLLFGGKRLPEIARGIGEGIREFKKSLSDDKKNGDKGSAS
ncbi:MAG: twin-arginine translocase TatA/TatE family subunit [Candidatus Omnitrophica bacterium]|nr:twin-arginine translocase TatA/TatE family subunit [Candidatus Omnitrophota bacterium]